MIQLVAPKLNFGEGILETIHLFRRQKEVKLLPERKESCNLQTHIEKVFKGEEVPRRKERSTLKLTFGKVSNLGTRTRS